MSRTARLGLFIVATLAILAVNDWHYLNFERVSNGNKSHHTKGIL